MHFAHWLSIKLGGNSYQLRNSMTRRSTGLGHGSLAIEFSSDNKFARNCTETCLRFNQLKFNAFEGLFPEILSSCNEFSTNLKFHKKSMLCAIS